MNEGTATVGPVLFSAAGLAVLDGMTFDPKAKGSYECLSGGLIWPDEFPSISSPEWASVALGYVYRFLIAYRASLTLGEERAEFRAVWEQVKTLAPNWPGLRPERREGRALRQLRVAKQRTEKCLDALEARFEAGKKE